MLKLAFALLLLASPFAQADCNPAEPMCQAMNTLDSAFDCVTGETEASQCSADPIAEMAQASKDSRAALLALQPAGTNPQVILDINSLFDQLDQAIVELKAAGSDQAAQAAALTKIKAIRKLGHKEFKH